MRIVPFAVLLLVGPGLEGCDSVPDATDLALGTFELTVEGRDSRGMARLYPQTGLDFTPAAVYLAPCTADRFVLASDDFLTAEAGDEVEASVDFRPEDRSYGLVSGTVEVVGRTPEGIRGRFSLRLRDRSTGPVGAGETTARGAFYAATVEGDEQC